MEKNLIIHEKAEFFTPQELDTIELIGFESELKSLVEEISKLPSHEVFTIYIEGEYGSGKTLFIRKLLHELFKKNKKIIPFHIFIGGETGFKPFKSIEDISLKIKEFVEIGKTSPVIVGNKEGWENRLKIIKEAIEQSKELFVTPKLTETTKKTQDQQQLKELSRAEMQAFENFLKYIIKEGYIPAIIFDETERIFTGEAVLSGDDVMNFSYLLNEWHAFSRGHKMTPLILGISTTFNYKKLIETYKDNPQLQLINQYSGIDFIKDPSVFPLIPSFKMYYNKVLKMEWNPDTLKKLGQLIIGKNEKDPRVQLLDDLSYVLPNPRAVFTLKKSIEELKNTINKNFYIFEEQIKRERININGKTRQLVASTSTWLNNAKKLIQNLYFRINVKEEDKIKEILKIIEGNEEFLKTYESNKRKYKSKLFSLLYKLSDEIGIYEKVGDEYRLDKFLAAYLFEIPKLPDGSSADLRRIIDRIKEKVKEARQKRKEHRSKKGNEAINANV
jgi:hypothetical protein